MSDERLGDELRALGASLDVRPPDPSTVATAVLQRIATEEQRAPASRLRASFRRHRVRLAAVVVALLAALVLTPPVRAVVADWLGLDGVVVRPGPSEPSAPPPPTAAESGLSIAEARELVAFDPVVPAGLGEPDGVEVSAGGRALSITWGHGEKTVRLDQFDAHLSRLLMKTAVIEEAAQPVDVGTGEALWFSEPHDLVLLDEHGRERPGTARIARPTLVWEVGETTLRLEGLDRQEAIAVAESTETGTG